MRSREGSGHLGLTQGGRAFRIEISAESGIRDTVFGVFHRTEVVKMEKQREEWIS